MNLSHALLRVRIPLLLFAAALGLAPLPAHAQVVIALRDQPAPGSGGGSFDALFTPSINDAGEVAFRATITGGTASQGIFVGTGSELEAVAVAGEPAPDSGGGSFNSFGDPVINNEGEIAFTANLSGGTVANVIYLASGGTISTLVVSQTTAPETGGGVYSAFTGLALNDAGEVAFYGNVNGGTTTTGIFAEGGANPRAIFLFDEATPAAAAGTYFNFSHPAINDSGSVAAVASISLTAGGFTSAVVVESGGVDEIVARIGDAAPGTGAGTYSFFKFFAAPALDVDGVVYFTADIAGGSAAWGLFADSDGTNLAVALQGEEAPDAGGADFLRFSDSKLHANDLGEVGFSASLQGGPPAQGLFIGSTDSAATALVFLGEAAPEPAGGTYLVLSDSPAINAVGAAAFRASLLVEGVGTSAIVRVPEASGAAPPLGVLAALAFAARRARRARASSLR